jgi:hypothetical protein
LSEFIVGIFKTVVTNGKGKVKEEEGVLGDDAGARKGSL